MSIRLRLILSYLVVVLVTLGLIAVLTMVTLDKLAEQNMLAAQKAVESITQANYRLSESVLTHYGEKIVSLKADAVARELGLMLRDRLSLEYGELRADPGLRAVGTQDIKTRMGRAGYLTVLDLKGMSVLHPNRNVEGRNFAEWKDKYPQMWDLVQQSFDKLQVQGYYTFIDRNNMERRKFMVLVRVPDTPLVVSAAVNIDQFFLPVQNQIRMAGQATLATSRREMTKVEEASRLEVEKAVGLGLLLALVVGLGFGLWFAASLSRPISDLGQAAHELGQGHFDHRVAVKGPSEIRQLAETMNHMGEELTDFTQRLKEETAARQAVMSEVKIARQIQESLLPRTFPAFPERDEFSLHAINLAAKEVAGDFYDFFFVGDNRLALIMADVSDKGIAAALFMAVTRTLFRNICHNEPDPALALARANEVLCEDNDAAMFVTLFLAYYDLTTGELTYANAGHNPPYLLEPDGTLTSFGKTGNVALGVLPGLSYRTERVSLKPGQTLVLYTDGVTEAADPAKNLFGEDRFEQLLRQGAGGPVAELSRRVVEVVDRFQAGNPADDLTLMLMRTNRLAEPQREDAC